MNKRIILIRTINSVDLIFYKENFTECESGLFEFTTAQCQARLPAARVQVWRHRRRRQEKVTEKTPSVTPAAGPVGPAVDKCGPKLLQRWDLMIKALSWARLQRRCSGYGSQPGWRWSGAMMLRTFLRVGIAVSSWLGARPSVCCRRL